MSRSVCLLAGLLCLTPVTLQAESTWVTVMQDQQRQVQFNRGTLNTTPDGNNRIAWARVLLTENKINAANNIPSPYTIIQALNRYDCRNRTIAVVRREYIDQRFNIIKTEQGNALHLIQPDRQSVDERLWQEACLPTDEGESSPPPTRTLPDIYQLVREANNVTIQASN